MGSKPSLPDGELSALCDLQDGWSGYALSLTSANATVAIDAGQYLMFTTSTDASQVVVMRLASGASDPTAPTNGGGKATDVLVWKAGNVEKLTAKTGALTLNAKLTTGTATLYLQKLDA